MSPSPSTSNYVTPQIKHKYAAYGAYNGFIHHQITKFLSCIVVYNTTKKSLCRKYIKLCMEKRKKIPRLGQPTKFTRVFFLFFWACQCNNTSNKMKPQNSYRNVTKITKINVTYIGRQKMAILFFGMCKKKG